MLSGRMDWSLITLLAEMEPRWQFVFVGPVADSGIVQRCSGAANIHFVGPVEPEAMPAVLHAFDVGLLPYRDTPFFHYLNPLKFYEMAAAGVPMVSSPIEELRHFPGDLVTVAEHNAGAWQEAIRAALVKDREAVRQVGREAVRDCVWENMSAQVLDRIAALIS